MRRKVIIHLGNPMADETGDWRPHCGQKYIKLNKETKTDEK